MREVQGPYEQIIPVSNYVPVSDGSAVLLKLLYPAMHTRYVRPVSFKAR